MLLFLSLQKEMGGDHSKYKKKTHKDQNNVTHEHLSATL